METGKSLFHPSGGKATDALLYVDDEPGLLEVGKIFLEQTGQFSVDTVTSATEALALLNTKNYDAIVSDYLMPEMDGLAFLKSVRSRSADVPFILFTGRGREEVVIEAINNGADFYLQKGGDPRAQFAELAHKIRHAITRRSAFLALQKRERDYRSLVENANEAIYVVQDEMVRMANPALSKMTGYSEQELTSLPMTTFIHPDDRAMVLKRYERRQRGEDVPPRYLFRLYRKDQTAYWVELSGVIISWNGRPATMVFLTDVSERKEAEDALKAREEQFRTLLETMPDIVLVHKDAIVVYANRMAVEKTGFSVEELLGSSILEHIVPGDRERVARNLATRSEGIKVEDYEIDVLDKSGEIHHVIVRTSPVIFNHEPAVAIILVDITERQRSEMALRESENLYRTIFETTGAATILIGEDTTILKANSGFAGFSGYSKEELEGKVSWTRFVVPEDLERMQQLHRERRKDPEHEVRTYEFQFIDRNGKVSLCMNNVRLIPGTKQSVASVVDISRWKETEEELRAAYEQLSAQEEALRQQVNQMRQQPQDS